MPRWVIVGHFIVDAATPDEAQEWLANELNQQLRPGEEGSAWQDDRSASPRYQLSGIEQLTGESPTPKRGKG